MVIDPTDQPCLRFIGISAMSLEIGEVMGLVISGAILMGTDVTIGFSRLSLW